MKAFVLVGLVFSAFLIILGIASIEKAGDVIAYASIVAGGMIFLFVAAIWTLSNIKEKREGDN